MKEGGLGLRVRVRKARRSDREAVFRFCKRTWNWGDYIPRVWDDWLKQKDSVVFVATVDGVPVGISHLSFDSAREVWLSGARTAPKFRRMGVATAITRKCLTYAKRMGARVVRLVTESENLAAQKVIEKLGFEPVAEFVEVKTEKVTGERSRRSRWAEEAEVDAVWDYVRASEAYREAAGLYTVLFHWYSFKKQDVKRFIKRRKAIVHLNRGGGVDGLVLFDDATAREWQEKTVQTCFIGGSYSVVSDMVRFFKSYCSGLSIKKIYAFVCNCRPVVRALEGLGFGKADSVDVVYTRQVMGEGGCGL